MNVLVIYHSITGNTEKMARSVADGVRSAGADVTLKRATDITSADLKAAGGIIIGSPTYYGLMAAEVKQIFDRSIDVRGQLENKVGAAFTSSGSPEGGNQTALLSILHAMLIHSMIVVGDPMATGGHFGIISVGIPNSNTLEACEQLGARVAELAKKISA
jgi:NAD(P)H dehydrogenase (quinone)